MAENNSPDNKIVEEFTLVLKTLSAFKLQITALSNQVRNLEKNVKKRIKQLEKEVAKKNKGNRKPSGFAVPTNISEPLCKFMGKPSGTQIARTEVTKYIISYIKTNNLQWDKNHKVIKPDKALRSLLDVKKGDEVTYFNIQKYMNKHFLKL